MKIREKYITKISLRNGDSFAIGMSIHIGGSNTARHATVRRITQVATPKEEYYLVETDTDAEIRINPDQIGYSVYDFEE